jgi:hypothetical protein
MKRLMLVAIFFAIAAPTFAQGPEEFVGKWKSDPGTPTMTRELTLEGKTIVMIELQPGRNGGPDLTIIRKYPTDGSEVTMDIGMWAGSKVTGKLEGKVLTCDTTMPNGAKFHDVWTLADDGKSYTNEMVITGMRARGGQGAGGGAANGGGQSGAAQTNDGQGAGGSQPNDAGKSADSHQSTPQASGGQSADSAAPRTVKFSFSRVE